MRAARGTQTLLLVLAAAIAAAACGRDAGAPAREPAATDAGAAARAGVPPLPDLGRLAPTLQDRLRRQHEAVRQLHRDGAAAAPLAEAYGEMGRLLVAAEFVEAAAPHFGRARELATGDFRWPYYLGHVARLTQQPSEAAALFEQALALRGDYLPALFWLGTVHLVAGRAGDAAVPLARAVEVDPRSAAAWFARGRAALASGDPASAIRYLRRATELADEDAPAAERASAIGYQLGLAYRAAGDESRAEPLLRRPAAADVVAPEDPLLDTLAQLLEGGSAFYAVRGLRAMEQRDWAAAVADLRTAGELSPDDGAVQLNLATASFLYGDRAAARRAAEAAVRLDPGLPKAHYVLGLILEDGADDRGAIARFTEAVRLDPEYAEAHASLADALRRSGRVDASLGHYERVLQVNPAASPARFGYAMALVRLGRYREARDWLQHAASLHPDQPGFSHALARVLAAAPDDAIRNGREALRLTDALLRTHQSAALSETMAMTLAELGRYEEAIRWQETAIEAAVGAGARDAVLVMQDNLARYRRGEPCRMPWSPGDPVHVPAPQREGS